MLFTVRVSAFKKRRYNKIVQSPRGKLLSKKIFFILLVNGLGGLDDEKKSRWNVPLICLLRVQILIVNSIELLSNPHCILT